MEKKRLIKTSPKGSYDVCQRSHDIIKVRRVKHNQAHTDSLKNERSQLGIEKKKKKTKF